MKRVLIAVVVAMLAGPVSAQSPEPSPIPAPQVTFPGATPAPAYAAVPCSTLIRRAGLVGKKITAEALGMLVAQALRDHGFRAGSSIDRAIVGKALVDFAGCFGGSK